MKPVSSKEGKLYPFLRPPLGMCRASLATVLSEGEDYGVSAGSRDEYSTAAQTPSTAPHDPAPPSVLQHTDLSGGRVTLVVCTWPRHPTITAALRLWPSIRQLLPQENAPEEPSFPRMPQTSAPAGVRKQGFPW